jgi:hypothetical protein
MDAVVYTIGLTRDGISYNRRTRVLEQLVLFNLINT